MKSRTAINIVLLLLIVAAGAFLAYRKFRKHDVVLSVSATECKGVVEVEHAVFEDDQQAEAGRHDLADGAATAKAPASWTSPTLSYRAGAQFTVLARGACKAMSCSILIDGQLVGQGGVRDKEQVSCTAMVGN